MDVVIPANTTASVYVPSAGGAEAIMEGGKPLAQAEGVRVLRVEGGRTVLACEAGAYRFTATLPPRAPARGVELPKPQVKPQPQAQPQPQPKARPAPGPTIPEVFE
jgi:hypothetical protein